jgi:hypothetical protein
VSLLLCLQLFFFPLTLPRCSLEHGIKPDGTLDANNKSVAKDGTFKTFFSETPAGKCDPRIHCALYLFSFNVRYVPRAIYLDLEPSVIDDVKTGPYAYGISLRLLQLIHHLAESCSTRSR